MNATDTLAELFLEHSVDAHVIDSTRGPAVTRYAIGLGNAVRPERVLALQSSLEFAFGTESITVTSPIEGRPGALGVDIPNRTRDVVLFDVADIDPGAPPLTFVIGRGIGGDVVLGDLASAPHVLIAGQTGSGKSVAINTLLCSLIARNTPDDLRLILIDPKRVELTPYAGLPHLERPVITDVHDAIGALESLVSTMEQRYLTLERHGVRNVSELNTLTPGYMPYVVCVIDELADLVLVAGKDVERHVVRLTQLARAAGIHLVLATQRPSTQVVTGLIKANVPSRLAFAVASNVDSRVILDANGAERLLGKGDGLWSPAGSREPIRVQGALADDANITGTVAAWPTHKPEPDTREPEEREPETYAPEHYNPSVSRALWALLGTAAGLYLIALPVIAIAHAAR